MCGCLLRAPYWGLGVQPGMCPDGELNPPPFGLQAGAQFTEPLQPGPLVDSGVCPDQRLNPPPWVVGVDASNQRGHLAGAQRGSTLSLPLRGEVTPGLAGVVARHSLTEHTWSAQCSRDGNLNVKPQTTPELKTKTPMKTKQLMQEKIRTYGGGPSGEGRQARTSPGSPSRPLPSPRPPTPLPRTPPAGLLPLLITCVRLGPLPQGFFYFYFYF